MYMCVRDRTDFGVVSTRLQTLLFYLLDDAIGVQAGLDSNWSPTMSVPFGHLSKNVGSEILRETYSQYL